MIRVESRVGGVEGACTGEGRAAGRPGQRSWNVEERGDEDGAWQLKSRFV